MTRESIFLVGAGGHARDCIDVIGQIRFILKRIGRASSGNCFAGCGYFNKGSTGEYS